MKNQEALTELIAEVLDQDLVDISIRSFKVFEAFESGRVELSATSTRSVRTKTSNSRAMGSEQSMRFLTAF